MAVARSGILWRRIFVILLFITTLSYVVYSRREFPHGGSPWGLTYGITGTLLILLLAYFGIRKRSYKSTFGTVEQWLQSHIYLGILAFVVLLFHTGGRFNDSIAVTTLLLVGIVVFSGIVGAVFYVTIPRLLTEVESNLTVEEISEQLNQLAKQMARVATGHTLAFQRIYDELIRESRPGFLAGWGLLFTTLRRQRFQSGRDLPALLRLVPKDEQEDLRQMLVVSRQRRELLLRLMFQQRYKNVLESWLYIHVPFTIALLVFAAVHITAVFYYGRVAW
jgi:predicted membrane channel-forming protein YqfA (hemolysin III family)